MCEEKSPVQRDEKGRFVKGVSGNPSGRPPLPPDFRRFGREAAARLRAIADDPDTPVKLKAEIEWFFIEGVYGKAASRTEKEGKGSAPSTEQTIKFEGVLEEWSG
ncbi:MAG: hypothetical protein E7445_02325 [Ruminococcaceae bacterium]|nr:hypothetical protein [Oscillospiraceae bacterium]